LWDQPGLNEDVKAGRYYLPGALTGRRETIITSPIEAAPQYLARLPGPGWTPVLAAVFTAAFFLLLTVKLVMLAAICAVLAVIMIVAWMWDSDPEPIPSVDVGGGVRLPTYVSGPSSHSWWAMVVLLLVAGALYLSYVFSYLYLWTVSPQVWPVASGQAIPSVGWPAISVILLLCSSGMIFLASRILAQRRLAGWLFVPLILLATGAMVGSSWIEIVAHWETGLRANGSSYGAIVYMASFLQLEVVLPLVVMTGFVLARWFAGRLNGVRRVTFDNLSLFWHYSVGQGLLGLLLVHGFPRLVG
jgi:cytochrome c oxidase subunit I+III